MPTRLIREGILDSPRLGAVSPMAELFYRKLMSIVDDYGRHELNLAVFRARLYAQRIDEVSQTDIGNWLIECSTGARPLIRTYPAGDKQWIQIEDFGQQTRSKSKCPPPPLAPDNTCEHPLSNVHLVGVGCVVGCVVGDGDGDGDGPGKEKVLTQKTDESWQMLLRAADKIPLVRSTDNLELHKIWVNHKEGWCSLDGLQRKAAVEELTGNRYPDPAYAPTLEKYVYKKKWLETIRPASNGASGKPPTKAAPPLSDREKLMGKEAYAK